MNLEEALKVYRDCPGNNTKACDTCPIIKVCHFFVQAEKLLKTLTIIQFGEGKEDDNR